MIHVTCTESSGKVTDMADAHKRGKRCRVAYWQGWRPCVGTNDAGSESSRSFNHCCEMTQWLRSLTGTESFDDVAAEMRRRVEASGLRETLSKAFEEDIRAIDAPRPKLLAGVPGKWSASADERFVSVDDCADMHNEPCVITSHVQKSSAAYAIAAKVWDRVKSATTFGEAWRILQEAGWRGHYFCRVD